MGLDVTAYRQISKIDAVYDADGEPIDPQSHEVIEYDFKAYINYDFPGRADDVQDRCIYRAVDSMGFRAGSYGGYNAWRNELARMAGYAALPVDPYNVGKIQYRHDQGAWAEESGPFWELINFSDCEGVIGQAVSKKLAKDFAEFDSRAKDHDGGPWFYDLYQEWKKAFEMAADGGAVDFH